MGFVPIAQYLGDFPKQAIKEKGHDYYLSYDLYFVRQDQWVFYGIAKKGFFSDEANKYTEYVNLTELTLDYHWQFEYDYLLAVDFARDAIQYKLPPIVTNNLLSMATVKSP